MSDNKKTAAQLKFFSYFLCLILMLVLFASTIYEGKEAGWGKWVYDYQTLITGITAVAAAWLTIHQMKAIDRRQAHHTEAAMALGIRSEFLVVERLCTYAIPQLELSQANWHKCKFMADLDNKKFFDALVEEADDVTNWYGDLRRILKADVFDQAQALFNSRTHNSLMELRREIKALSPIMNFLFDVTIVEVTEQDIAGAYRELILLNINDPKATLAGLHGIIGGLHHELVLLEINYREVANKSEFLRKM